MFKMPFKSTKCAPSSTVSGRKCSAVRTMSLSLCLLSIMSMTANADLCLAKETGSKVRHKEVKAVVSEKKEGGFNYAVGAIEIDAPAEKIWQLVTDYDHADEIFSNLKKCEVVGTDGDTKLVRQFIQPAGSPIKFDYVVALKEKCPQSITWSRVRGSLKECKGAWEFAPLKNNTGTKVTYSIYLDGGMWLPAWILHNQVKGYLPTMLKSLKTKAEG